MIFGQVMTMFNFHPDPDPQFRFLCEHGGQGTQEVTAALGSKRLKWYGYVFRPSNCIKSITNTEVPCSRARGRPRKTWSDCVKADITAWRSGV